MWSFVIGLFYLVIMFSRFIHAVDLHSLPDLSVLCGLSSDISVTIDIRMKINSIYPSF